jgi:high-affinity iron transporter
MIPGLLLAFREGLEAALILGILLGTLTKLGRQRQARYIWFGSLAALLVSLVSGIGLGIMGASLDGEGEAVFEGLTMLSAALVLTWALFWMRLQADLHSEAIVSGVREAIIQGSRVGLFSLAFFTIVREGIELSLFLTAASMSSGSAPTLLGALVGLLLAVALGFGLYSRMVRLNLKPFFLYSSILLMIFAAGLVAHGLHELIEAGWIPGVIEPVWRTGALLAEDSLLGQMLKTLVGYNADPALTETIGYFGYLIVVTLAMRKTFNQPAASAGPISTNP